MNIIILVSIMSCLVAMTKPILPEEVISLGIKTGRNSAIFLITAQSLILFYAFTTLGENPREVSEKIFITLKTLELAAGTFGFCCLQDWIDSGMENIKIRNIGILALIYTLFL